LRAQGGRIPELTRVIVAYQNQIVMEPTLEAGLARLFGASAAAAPGAPGAPGAPSAPSPAAGAPGEGPPTSLAADALATYERAIAAQKAGDWARYGEEIKRLGELLAKMRQ
jgi:uncharacterized membrane protein (UPF0182 family)